MLQKHCWRVNCYIKCTVCITNIFRLLFTPQAIKQSKKSVELKKCLSLGKKFSHFSRKVWLMSVFAKLGTSPVRTNIPGPPGMPFSSAVRLGELLFLSGQVSWTALPFWSGELMELLFLPVRWAAGAPPPSGLVSCWSYRYSFSPVKWASALTLSLRSSELLHLLVLCGQVSFCTYSFSLVKWASALTLPLRSSDLLHLLFPSGQVSFCTYSSSPVKWASALTLPLRSSELLQLSSSPVKWASAATGTLSLWSSQLLQLLFLSGQVGFCSYFSSQVK